MDESKLLSQVFSTYNWLRFGLVFIGVAFPILLWLWGKVHHLPLQDSMSAYYWASIEGYPPVRVWFVGGLFAMGSFLFIYKGYTSREDWALNVAAVLVILVALVPMSWNCGSDCPRWSLHYLSAIGFFLCLSYVAFFEARRTLGELGDQWLQKLFDLLYWVTSACFLVLPFVVLGVHWRTQSSTLTFWLEASLIYAFALFWFIKSVELLKSEAERGALQVAQAAAEEAKRRALQEAQEAAE
jgi:hypothetical protein